MILRTSKVVREVSCSLPRCLAIKTSAVSERVGECFRFGVPRSWFFDRISWFLGEKREGAIPRFSGERLRVRSRN